MKGSNSVISPSSNSCFAFSTILSIWAGCKIGAASFSSSAATSVFPKNSSISPSIILVISSDFFPSSSSILMPNSSASSGSFEISGMEFPLSQLDTAWKLIFSRSASSICVILLTFLNSEIFLPISFVSNIFSPFPLIVSFPLIVFFPLTFFHWQFSVRSIIVSNPNRLFQQVMVEYS